MLFRVYVLPMAVHLAGAAAAAFLTTSTEGRGKVFSHLSPMQRAQLAAELGATAAPATQASPAAMGTVIVPPTPNPTHLATTHPCAQSYATATASMGGGQPPPAASRMRTTLNCLSRSPAQLKEDGRRLAGLCSRNSPGRRQPMRLTF